MSLIFFSKSLQDHDLFALVERGRELGVDGYDLAVRPGYSVCPENVTDALPRAQCMLKEAGLAIQIVTAKTDLVRPDDPSVRPILAAMAEAGVPMLKMGYFHFDPAKQDYWAEVDQARHALDGWQTLAREYGVKVCYHTHSGANLGNNCAAAMHLIQGRDPALIGAYLDPGHLALEGGPFAMDVAIVGQYLSAVALKDSLRIREQRDCEGAMGREIMQAGDGMVAWSQVFDTLLSVGFAGPFSVHAEFKSPDAATHLAGAKREVCYFRQKLAAAKAARS